MYGLTYEADMDQLIVSLMDSCNNDIDNTDNAQDLNPNECDTNDTKVTDIVNISDTKCQYLCLAILEIIFFYFFFIFLSTNFYELWRSVMSTSVITEVKQTIFSNTC